MCVKDIWQGSLGWLEQGFYLFENLKTEKDKSGKSFLIAVLGNMTGTSDNTERIKVRILTQGNVCDDTAEYERCQKRQRDDEAVEKAVVAFAHAVPHPWAVMIKSF